MNIFLKALQKQLLYYVMKMQMATVESEQDESSETVSGDRHTSQKTAGKSLSWVGSLLLLFFFLASCSFGHFTTKSLFFISVFPPTTHLN